MKISSRAIIFKGNKIILIYREKDNKKYYVFPGGKIEENETKEECVIRECKEELGINVIVKKYVYLVKGKNFVQHFHLCEWVDGDFGTGNPEEYDINRIGGVQIPKLINIEELNKLKIISPQIIDQLLLDLKNCGKSLDSHVKEINEI